MAVSSEKAVELFQSLPFPFPVYHPVEGQLKNDIAYALEQLQQCSKSLVFEDASLQLQVAIALQCLARRDEATTLYQHIKDATDKVRLKMIAGIEIGIALQHKLELEAAISLAEEHPDEVLLGGDHFRVHVVDRGKCHLGLLYYQENNFANAARYLEAGLSVPWPDTFNIHYQLGVSHGRIGNHTKAVEHLELCINLRSPDHGDLADVYQTLGDIHHMSAKYEEAARAFVQSASLAAKLEGNSTLVSFRWWAAGSIFMEHCHDYEQATQSLVMSLKAALNIQDSNVQALRLTAASTWLYACIRGGFESKSLDQLLQDKTLVRLTPGSCSNQELSLQTLKAEAYGNLGMAMLTCQSFDEAREFLETAISLLTLPPGEPGEQETKLTYRFRFALAALYSLSDDHHKALEAFRLCKLAAPTERERLKCDIRSCFATISMGSVSAAVSMLETIEKENETLLATDWELKAEVLLGLGKSMLSVGDVARGFERLEAAMELLEAAPGHQTFDLLPLTYAVLYNGLVQNGLFLRAFDLMSRFEQVSSRSSNDHKAGFGSEILDLDGHVQLLRLYAACNSRLLMDNDGSRHALTELLEQPEHVKDSKLKFAALCALASVYANQEDYDAAEAKYDEAISYGRTDKRVPYSQLYINRAELYRRKAVTRTDHERDDLNKKALDDYTQAIHILEEAQVFPLDLAGAYTGQAVVLFHVGDSEAAHAQLDKAMNLSGSGGNVNQLLMAKIKRVRAAVLFSQGGMFERAVDEAREAALLLAEVQAKLQHLDFSWITLLEGDMKHLFFLLQKAWVNNGKCNDALLWAERGRMRLYFHLADQRLVNSGGSSMLSDPLAFDRDDDRALGCIGEAVRRCGTGCLVVEYTCSPAREELYIFIVWYDHDDQELVVKVERIQLKEFFSRENPHNRAMGGTLESLIRRTRTEIKRKGEAKAKVGLGTLYMLLLRPVWEVVNQDEFDTIIFAPSESIWFVPFAALYDESSSQFLIEKMKVGVIPSLRALQRCQTRNAETSLKFKQDPEPAKLAFVAGDPEPMGLNYSQLPGARQEAVQVAELLKVVPVIGRDMTKDAVIEGLKSDCSVITLITHGMVDRMYPHGALVMQAKEQQVKKRVEDIDRLVRTCNLVSKRSSDILQQSRDVEVLTASEIEKVDVHAALVVLSACQTGEGEAHSEGLLGLARAVLQAGTSCAVVTLWKVDDEATKLLMIGMFEELITNRRSMLEALRFSMMKLLKSGAPVYKWASAVALGYSMLKLTPDQD